MKSVPIRFFEAEKGIGMTESEVQSFLLECNSNLLLGTVDASGAPSIHPVWYHYEPRRQRLYIFTGKSSSKARNIDRKPEVYFDIDDDRWPYKGVRGKGRAKVVSGKEKALALSKKILTRYVKRDHPLAFAFLDSVGKGESVVIEITPAFFSTWDYRKLPPRLRRDDLRKA